MPLTRAELLALHPWPPGYDDAKKIERLWSYDLPGTPAQLWRFVSDTSRMNRALGTSEMTFVDKAGKRYGSSRTGGVRHEWLEVPWNWIAEQWLTSHRVYERGFFKATYTIHHFEPSDSGTRLYLYFGTVPRGPFSATAIRIGFPTLERAYRRVLPALASQLDQVRPEILQLPPGELVGEAVARLRAGAESMRADGLPAECIEALCDWIRSGDEAELHRIQIRERARVWKLPELDLLRTALHATRVGLLDLSWDTICPYCRGMRGETGKLAELEAHAHCEACALDFTTDKVETIEVTFRVHPSIRDIAARTFCSAEPANNDHIRAQATVPPGETAVIRPRLERGLYDIWRDHADHWVVEADDGAPGAIELAAHAIGSRVRVSTTPEITVANTASAPQLYQLQRATWTADALRPGHLLSFQEFRDLFSEDYIGADVKLAVGEQTLLFTDVVGSTAFYARRGDPAAFVEIKRHFDEVFAIVGKHRGAVVKTIGDAVMATFVNPVDALRAARGIHDAFHPRRDDTPIRLRISLNTGPCIAVRLNANADFFGGTVNIAAKLQALAEAYQIAMSDATYRAAGVAEYLAEQQAPLEDLTYESKALREPVKVKRWTVSRDS